jgi:hypothetical protein
MKTLLSILGIIIFTAVLTSCGENTVTTADVRVINTVKIGNLEVMTEDLGEPTMDWDDAMKACADLGDGWRLPTKDELNILYENKDKIGGFANNFYWSSTEDDSDIAWGQGFNDGTQNLNAKFGNFFVRSVRAF